MSHSFISSLLRGLYCVLLISMCFIMRFSGIYGWKYWAVIIMFYAVYMAGYYIGRFETEKKGPPK